MVKSCKVWARWWGIVNKLGTRQREIVKSRKKLTEVVKMHFLRVVYVLVVYDLGVLVHFVHKNSIYKIDEIMFYSLFTVEKL